MPQIDTLMIMALGGFLLYLVLFKSISYTRMVVPIKRLERLFLFFMGSLVWITFIFPAGLMAGENDLTFYSLLFLAYAGGVAIANVILRRNDD